MKFQFHEISLKQLLRVGACKDTYLYLKMAFLLLLTGVRPNHSAVFGHMMKKYTLQKMAKDNSVDSHRLLVRHLVIALVLVL